MSLGLGYNSLKLNIFLSGSPAHAAPGVLLSLYSFWCFLCRLPSLGHRAAFLCSLLCSYGTRHLPPVPCYMSVAPQLIYARDVSDTSCISHPRAYY